MANSFGSFIRKARERKKLSLSEAAQLAKCTKTHLWEMEQGKTCNPSIRILSGLTDAYGLKLAEVARRAAFAAAGGKP